MEQDEEYQRPFGGKTSKVHNILPLWGNEQSMNLNPLILANIQGSSYFKVHLFKLKTYHEVVDEIYYQVKHLEPWEKGSRKTAGQTGMCGGVRGVGAGGIVSTAYCLLYKLYTLRLTRKQVNGLLTHTDSPYIRALGFMYIRYTQPPSDMFDWYEEYLEDDEEIDIKAGGGQTTTIGALLKQWLVKLDWFSTLFPRIPVPVQKQIEQRLAEYNRSHGFNNQSTASGTGGQYSSEYRDYGNNRDQGYSRDQDREREPQRSSPSNFGEAERYAKVRNERYNNRDRDGGDSSTASRSRDKHSERERSYRDAERSSRDKDRSRDRPEKEHRRHKHRHREGSNDKHRSRSRERERKRHR